MEMSLLWYARLMGYPCYRMSVLWDARLIGCPSYRMPVLWDASLMGYPCYRMPVLWNVRLMEISFLWRCPSYGMPVFDCIGISIDYSVCLFNKYVTLSCLYAKFRWLISHVQLSFQPLSGRMADNRGKTADLIRVTDTDGSPRQRSVQFLVVRVE